VVAIGVGSVGATTVEPAGDGAASGAGEAGALAGAATEAGSTAIGVVGATDEPEWAGRDADAEVLAIGIVAVGGTAGVVWIAGVAPTEADPEGGTAGRA
jgi:hypothetical protein